MKSKQLLIGLFSSLFLLAGCTNDDLSLNDLWPFESHSLTTGVTKTNADILGEIITVDKTEIASAEYAQKKAQHPKVKRFAAYLHHGHNKNLHEALKLSRTTGIAPTLDATAIKIQNGGQTEVEHLKSLDKSEFDKVYLTDSVKGHEDGLKLIDKDIAASTDAKVTSFLKETRKLVAAHLHKAKKLLSEIK